MTDTIYSAAAIWLGEIFRSPKKNDWETITSNIAELLKKKKNEIEDKINGVIISSEFRREDVPFVEAVINNIVIKIDNINIDSTGILRIKPCVYNDGPQFSKIWFVLEHHKSKNFLPGNSLFKYYSWAKNISSDIFQILKNCMEESLREDLSDSKFNLNVPEYTVEFKVASSYSSAFNLLLEKSQSLGDIIELISNPDYSHEKEYYLDIQSFAYNNNINTVTELLELSDLHDIQWRFRESRSDDKHNNEDNWKGYYAIINDEYKKKIELTAFVTGKMSNGAPKYIHNFPSAIVNESIDII